MKTIRRWKLLSTNGSVEMCTTALNSLDTDGGEGGIVGVVSSSFDVFKENCNSS